MAWYDRLTGREERQEELILEESREPQIHPENVPEGYELFAVEEAEQLREAVVDARMRDREAERLAYEVLSEWPIQGREMRARDRRRIVRQIGEAWERDPQAGAAVDLMNDFTLGRGAPRPRAKAPEVQAVLDEAWDDPDNQVALTSQEAQYAFGTDLSLQSNLFFLAFDDGDDGKVKLSILDHDTVENAVRDENNRLMVLRYVAAFFEKEWDYEKDRYKDRRVGDKPKILYYDHWRNVEDAIESGERVAKVPSGKRGAGKVYHVAINRRGEQVFGVPTMRRLLRWFSAYNEFMTSRVDIAKAAAAFIMKRKIRGGPNKVLSLAQKVMNNRSELAARWDEEQMTAGPKPASIVNENEGVSHEPFNLNTNSANAKSDGEMIQGQVAAGTHFPATYYGASPGSLAGATAVELPVLKACESRQEVIEGTFRWFFDLTIKRAQEVGRLPTPDAGRLSEAGGQQMDLSYEFSLPNPQRRMMGELVSSIANIAKTFDPNGTNVELSRTLLALALGQGLEVENPADAVERIFPEGYVDPITAALQAQQAGGGGSQEEGGNIPPGGSPTNQVQKPTNTGFPGPNGRKHSEENPYGAKREGMMVEGRWVDLPELVKVRARGRELTLEELYDAEMSHAVELSMAELDSVGGSNGHRAPP